MKTYTRITRTLQRTAEQLRALNARNNRKTKAHSDRIRFFDRIHKKVTDFKGDLVVRRYMAIAALNDESRRAESTATKIEGLLS